MCEWCGVPLCSSVRTGNRCFATWHRYEQLSEARQHAYDEVVAAAAVAVAAAPAAAAAAAAPAAAAPAAAAAPTGPAVVGDAGGVAGAGAGERPRLR